MKSLSLVLVTVTACGAARTVAATAPGSPTAFDAARSDPKAIAVADQVLAAVGGEAAWAKVKQLRWAQKFLDKDNVVLEAEQAWDRWEGRHHLDARAGGSHFMTMYELWGDRANAYLADKDDDLRLVSGDQKKKLLGEAKKRWIDDAYSLTMQFRLKDPGVQLAYLGERPELGAQPGEGGAAPPMKYEVLKVTFAAKAGPRDGDVYRVYVDKETHLIDSTEYLAPGKPQGDTDPAVAYKWGDWVDAGGLKFATTRQNMGYPEKVVYSDVKVAEKVDEELFVPTLEDTEKL